ncbi:hypothetical protein cyc_00895 [Cyclospora cayetanensis]|uniref:Uncharacterized protein n=1 Tax=Cyclospora cayetanensis TaxID=88456 RepID=A0A1D3D2H9_9EIME|nr:hypothetical protein cyc_00895 [Cyclospora cayetanensis]
MLKSPGILQRGKRAHVVGSNRMRDGNTPACVYPQLLVCDKGSIKRRESQRDADACKRHASAGSTNPRPSRRLADEWQDLASVVAIKTNKEFQSN